jgi:hypothetical protein
MADDVIIDITLEERSGHYDLNSPVAGTIRLRSPRPQLCERLDAGLVFIQRPTERREWSDEEQIATAFAFGPAQTAEFPFLIISPPTAIPGTGEWYVEVRATVDQAHRVERRLVTLPTAGPRKPRRAAGKQATHLVAPAPWTVPSGVARSFYALLYVVVGLVGIALGLDVWNQQLPLEIRLFGLLLLLGSGFGLLKGVHQPWVRR